MRIISGTAGGRKLAVPPKGTRPTSDRAREALFNTLASNLELAGAHVLDLFAGSGAVGLEALSRGAAKAVFVESAKPAGDVLRANIDSLGFGSRARLERKTVEFFVAGSAGVQGFDLIFADPPYALDDETVSELLTRLGSDQWLAPGGLIVVERSARSTAPAWPDEIKAIKQRRYGEGCLWYGRRG